MGLVVQSCNPTALEVGNMDGLCAEVLLVVALCRSGVHAKPGVDMVAPGEPRLTRSSKEGRTGPGWKHSKLAVVGQRL